MSLAFFDFLFCDGINANLLSVFAHSFKLNGAVNKSEQSIVFSHSYAVACLELGAALSYKDISRKHVLSVRALNAEHFGITVSAVVRRTGTFLMGE